MHATDGTPIATLSVMIVSSFLVLSVVLGGIVMIWRSRRPAEVVAVEPDIEPESAPQEISTQVLDKLPEERELTGRIAQLERAVSELSRALELTVSDEDEPRLPLTIISRSEQPAENVLSKILELRRRGLDAEEIAGRLHLSEEQLRLLLNVAVHHNPDRAVGA